jgi:hypothetical protein
MIVSLNSATIIERIRNWSFGPLQIICISMHHEMIAKICDRFSGNTGLVEGIQIINIIIFFAHQRLSSKIQTEMEINNKINNNVFLNNKNNKVILYHFHQLRSFFFI